MDADTLADQLASKHTTPPVPTVLSMLSAQVDSGQVAKVYDRFLWEARRGVEHDQALENALFFASLAGNPLGDEDPRKGLQRQIDREAVTLGSLERWNEGEVTVFNMGQDTIRFSRKELMSGYESLVAPRKLIMVVDESPAPSKVTDDTVIWQVSSNPSEYGEAWEWLLSGLGVDSPPEWLRAAMSFRQLVCASDSFQDELQIRAHRAERFLVGVLTQYTLHDSEEEVGEESISEEEAEWALRECRRKFLTYSENPRLTLDCQSIENLLPRSDWQGQGPQSLRALAGAVTGDDIYLTALLQSSDRLRLGTLSFSGDPDQTGDDILSASMPASTCSVVLKPSVLKDTLFLAGFPHPTAIISVPQTPYGYYSTVAFGEDARHLMWVKTLMNLTSATPASAADYVRGRGNEVTLNAAQAGYGFRSLVTAIGHQRLSGPEDPEVQRILRGSVLYAMFGDQMRAPDEHSIGGIHIGPLGLEDIEEVVVTLKEVTQFSRYMKTGQLPSYLRPTASFFEKRGIRVRARPPVTVGAFSIIR